MCDINVHTDTTVPSGKPHEAKVSKDIEVGNRSNNTLWKRQSIIKYKANLCPHYLSMLKSSSSGDESMELSLLLGPSEL